MASSAKSNVIFRMQKKDAPIPLFSTYLVSAVFRQTLDCLRGCLGWRLKRPLPGRQESFSFYYFSGII